MEGDTFEFDENGEPVFTDKILNNENGWTMTQTVASYLCPSAGIANWSDWTRELAGVPERTRPATTCGASSAMIGACPPLSP